MKLFYLLPLLILFSCNTTKKTKSNTPITPKKLIGKWMIIKLAKSNKSELEKNNAFIEFTASTGSASIGCNTFNFPYTRKNNTINIQNLFSTRMHCEALTEQENSLSSELKKINSFSVKGNSLILTTSTGSTIEAIAK